MQKTNLDEQEIRSILHNYHKANIVSYTILILWSILAFITYISDSKGIDWKPSLIRGTITVLLLYLAYKIVPVFAMYILSPDYVKLEHLIQLTT